jgi:DNA-binding transcriptional LysR family regulator
MSQSAASAALQQLEHNYDAILFDRIGKSLRLSKVGYSLRPEAEALIAHAEKFHHALEGHEDVGHLNVGASLTIGNYLAVEYLARYLTKHPEAKTNFHVASSPEIVAQVLNFDLDIGLVEVEVQHKELDVIPWRKDRLRVFCNKHHPLAKKKVLDQEDILQANWILREPDSGARQTFDRAMHGLQSKMNIYLELTHNEAIKRAVETGIGIGCLSEIALESAIKRGDLVPLELPKREMHRTFYFVLHKERHPNKAVDWWIELCKQG